MSVSGGSGRGEFMDMGFEQPSYVRGIAGDHLRCFGDLAWSCLLILEIGQRHRLADP